MATYRPEINITAEEVNALIYSYLQDSGFAHSAFTLRQESRLDKSEYDSATFRRGLLTELLAKALLYTEVEIHWKQVPGSCNAPFSLLKTHECTYRPQNETSALSVAIDNRRNGHDKADKESDNDLDMVDSTIAKLEILPPNQLLLSPNRGEVFVCSWNPVYHDILATGSKDGWAHVWQLEPGLQGPEAVPPRPIASIRTGQLNHEDDGQEVTWLEWNRQGTLLAIGSSDPMVRIWSKSTGRLIFTNAAQTSTIASVRFSPNGTLLLASALDCTIVLWDVEKNKLIHKWEAGKDADVLPDIAWINDTSWATTWVDNTIQAFVSAASNHPFRIFRGHTGEVNRIAITSDRKLLASVADDRTAKVWNLEPLRLTWKAGDVFVPVEGTVGGNLHQNCIHTFSGHTGIVQHCRWVTTPGEKIERLLVTASDDNTARLWDATAGTCLRIFEDHLNNPLGLCISPDHRYIATAAMDGWTFIYSVEAREMVACWRERADKANRDASFYDVDWSKDGRRIAVGIQTARVGVVDVSNLKVVPPMFPR